MLSQTFYLIDWKTIEEEAIDANIHFIVTGSYHNLYTVKVHENDTITCDCPDFLAVDHEPCLCKHCCFVLAKIAKVHDIDILRTRLIDSDAMRRLESAVYLLSALTAPIPVSIPNQVICTDGFDAFNDFTDLVDSHDAEGCKNLGEDCSICWDVLASTDIDKMKKCSGCHNAFHNDCIRRWMQQNPSCPLCRRNTRRQGADTDVVAPRYINITHDIALLNRGHSITNIAMQLQTA